MQQLQKWRGEYNQIIAKYRLKEVEVRELQHSPAWEKFKKNNGLDKQKLTAGKVIMTLRVLAREQREAVRGGDE